MEEAEFHPTDDNELIELRRRYERTWQRFDAEKTGREHKARQERYQRDMGVGYLIWIARQYRRITQEALARTMGTSRPAVSRWEAGERLPSLSTLQKVAWASNLQLLVGLRDPEDPEGNLLALGIVFDEGVMAELLMLVDQNHHQLPATRWRLKWAREHPRDADMIL